MIALDEVLSRLHAEKGALEERMGKGWNTRLSAQLDRLVVAIESLEAYVREQRAA